MHICTCLYVYMYVYIYMYIKYSTKIILSFIHMFSSGHMYILHFISTSTLYYTEIIDEFLFLRSLNNGVNLLHIIRSFTSSINAFLIAKNGTKKVFSTILDKIITSGHILVFEVSRQPYFSFQHDRVICKWWQCLHKGQNLN